MRVRKVVKVERRGVARDTGREGPAVGGSSIVELVKKGWKRAELAV